MLSLLSWAGEYLTQKGFEEARLHSELLLAHILRLSRLDLYLQFDRPLTRGELDQFKSLFRRRLNHEPLQYILGETEFMGIPLCVGPGVLIPRPETELLVEDAVEVLKAVSIPSPAVLDVGTGSGNIALALARFVPPARITAVDISPACLDVARKNLERHSVLSVELVAGDMFAELFPDRVFDLVVSNPPYVPARDFDDLAPEIRVFEPRNATTDDADGFRCIRRIAELASARLVPGGTILMEIGYDQWPETREILEAAGLGGIAVRKDYAGIPRVARGRRASGKGGSAHA